MEGTSSCLADARAAPAPVSPTGLLAAFARVPDPRRHASVTYPRAPSRR